MLSVPNNAVKFVNCTKHCRLSELNMLMVPNVAVICMHLLGKFNGHCTRTSLCQESDPGVVLGMSPPLAGSDKDRAKCICLLVLPSTDKTAPLSWPVHDEYYVGPIFPESRNVNSGI